MKLSVWERFVILSNLPRGGSIEEAIVLPMITKKVSIPDDEKRRIKLKFDPVTGEPIWDEKRDKGIDVHFGKLERSVLKKHYEALSAAGQLPIRNPAIVEFYCKITGLSIESIKEEAVEDNDENENPVKGKR